MRSRSHNRLLAYVASPHNGYLKLFRNYEGGELGVMGESLISEFPALTRNLPGVSPADAVRMIDSLRIFSCVSVVERNGLIDFAGSSVALPDEDVSRAIAERYLDGVDTVFDAGWKLRWDLPATMQSRRPEGEEVVSSEDLDVLLLGKASEAALRSPDWWRQVGGVLVRDGTILLTTYNTHLPSEQFAYVYGDPRSNFNAGEQIDMSVALHTEVGLLAAAARKGIKTEGCDVYITTFPCPPCANAIAEGGIKRLVYRDGYSLVAGVEALRSRNVQIIRVQ